MLILPQIQSDIEPSDGATGPIFASGFHADNPGDAFRAAMVTDLEAVPKDVDVDTIIDFAHRLERSDADIDGPAPAVAPLDSGVLS